MVTPKQKICKTCEQLKFIWAYGNCKYCDGKVKAERQKLKRLEEIESKKNAKEEIRTIDIENYSILHIDSEKKENTRRTAKKGFKKKGKKYLNKAITPKQEKKYIENKRNLPKYCEGCGSTNKHLTPSHRVPTRKRPDLYDDPKNLDAMCLTCHDKVENWNLTGLRNEAEVFDYVKLADKQHFLIMQNLKFKREENK